MPLDPKELSWLEGKTAFVTGGSSGIGLGVAEALLDAGMNIALGYRTENHLADALDQLGQGRGEILPVSVNVADSDSVDRAFQNIINVFGKIHVAICNAGVFLPASIEATTHQEWEWQMNINLSGVFNTVKAALPIMRAHGERSHIVATSSVFGLYADPVAGAYCATKFGVTGLMEALYAELRGSPIGVSVYCPGDVSTRIVQSRRSMGARIEDLPTIGSDSDPWHDMQTSITPSEAGQVVLQGLCRGDLYILSHPEFGGAAQSRAAAISRAFDKVDQEISEARKCKANALTHSSFYNEL